MRRSRRQRPINRNVRFESVEPRLLMAGDPSADLFLDYFVESQVEDDFDATLADAHELTGLDGVREQFGFTGAGQTVVVIDTGIAYDHVALGAGFGTGYRVVGGYDFAENDADPYDDAIAGSHGTHVAGIIGSSDAFSPGVAPEVDLIGLRVFNDTGEGYFGDVADALDWVYDNLDTFENPITAINLSIGTRWNSDSVPGWAMLEEEFARLEAEGVFISVAAGNSFLKYEEPGVSYPAASPHVVPVASVDDDGSLSYFSQRSQRVIAAPGRGIRSTVPDYVGNRDNVANDFANFSGTSMAAPYVAGASVLLRQAYEFVGIDDVSQSTLYQLMLNTADTIFDPETGRNYCRLNLTAAIDAVMPADDFGSSTDTAYDMGTIEEQASLNGTIAALDDLDWFSFTAGRTGTLSVEVDATGDLAPNWQLSGASLNTAAIGDAIEFDVAAGQSYSIGLATDDGLGHYTLDVDLTPTVTTVDWGTVAQAEFNDLQIEGDGQSFQITAANDGILTIEAFFVHAAGDVDLQLFDAEDQLVGTSTTAGDSERIDVNAAAGDVFTLRPVTFGGGVNEDVDFRVTNLVSRSGDIVNVAGTAGDDHFAFTAGPVLQFTINNVDYQFDSTEVDTVAFNGGEGSDTAVLNGTAGNDQAVLRPGSAELSGDGYEVRLSSVESISLFGGGGEDRAAFYDSAGDDTFVALPGYAKLSGGGFVNQASGFEWVEARATAGGHDVAKLFDSIGNDQFAATPFVAELSGAGFTSRAAGFDYVHAYAGRGYDVAKLFDSKGSDQFLAHADQAALFGRGFYNRAKHFEEVHAYSTAGGTDVARLYDSAGDDTLTASPFQAALAGAGFYNRAKHFEGVHAYATAGGTDLARFYDSAGDDVFIATPRSAVMYGTGFYNRAKYFEQYQADATAGGHDRAEHYDTAGDDVLRAALDWASLANEISSVEIDGFEQVWAQASSGSNRTEVNAVDYLLELDGEWE